MKTDPRWIAIASVIVTITLFALGYSYPAISDFWDGLGIWVCIGGLGLVFSMRLAQAIILRRK